ncbi:ABC-type Fe3+-hydroxamate transport system, substrate-binding protein [Paenibacillus uliginis N3/975]|uniref:ABC-type Fe3+-hydroxamate transport system, substrate-binding protein n=1 Tax=Paenibacillus uliginis N3/975 TaxID=1313296 RepID=A0A1X7GWR3_9BACL|nr:helix-turn-helix domain-containing protein [Paenibacillus uliginis]SMF75760.1 ABC-type Fe3+-hydroxamate transport system, substrate-binding protein [Paenibacillus uliginis N3/975]
MLTPTAMLPPYSFHIPIRLIGLEKGIPSTSGDSQGADYRIVIIQDGVGMLHLDDRSYPISRGSVFVSGTLPDLKLESKRATPLRGIYIEYRCISIADSASYGLDCSVPLHAISSEILRMAGEFESFWRGPNRDEPFQMQLLFIKLLQEIHREMEFRNSSLQQSWVEQALQYIEKNYHKDVTREQMTALSGVSPEHFSRMFRKHTGRTFNAYLTLLRIRKAQERLLTGSQDLNALAQEIGYKEGLYLSRKFKESVGMSPTVYRRKPKRITALNLNHTASLLALGIIPELGVYTPWLQQTQYNKNLSTGHHFDPHTLATDGYYEAVASSSPDLIISYNSAEENKRMLSLAPVLELPFKTMSWREQFRFIACTMNKQTAAEDWLSRYDELADRVNGELNQVLGERGTAVVWEICTDTAYCFSGSFGRGSQVLYDDFGFRPPERLVEEGLHRDGFVEVDIGEIASYAADHIFITSLPNHPYGEERVNVLFRSQEWRNLDAVRSNRVYVLNQPDLFFGYDPISSEAQLHELMKVLRRHHKFA